LLEEQGQMTRAEICQAIGIPKISLSPVLTRMCRKTPKLDKRIYIAGWSEEHEGARRYPRAIYALGNERDQKKPARDRGAVRRRYEAGLRNRMTMNSVFNIGKPRRIWREELKAIT